MLYASDHALRASLCVAIPLFLSFLASCAGPNDPEVLNPAPPGYGVVARLATSGYAQSVVVRDTVAFLGQGEGGLFIASIADPRSPRRLAEQKEGLRGYNTRIAVWDTVVYVAAGDFGISVVNAADPARPGVTATNVGMRPARGLHLFGPYLFTAVSEQGVRIADLTEPTHPDVRGGISTPGYARGLCTTSDSALLLVACGEMGLAVYDIRDLAGGFGEYPLVRWVDTPGYAEDVVILDDPTRAALACGSAGVFIIDFADTLNPRITASVPPIGSSAVARTLCRDGSLVFVAAERGGVQIVDTGTPDRPRLLGSIPTPQAYGVAVDTGHLYVADRSDGLIVISRPAGR